LISATSSFTDFAGTPGFTIKTFGEAATKLTGEKSLIA
jgi:hypothetical protein